MVPHSELRCNLANLKSAFIPLKVSVKAFYDAGQVFYDGTDNDNLNEGYGGGFYIVPYSENLTISTALGFSEEESALLQVSIGALLRWT